MGGTPITKVIALKALKKLEAVCVAGAKHDIWTVYLGNAAIAQTGIRRSSKADMPHRHLKTDLEVPTQFVMDLARCPKSRMDYLVARRLVDPDST